MKITNAAIDHSMTVFVGLLIIIVVGLSSYQSLPREGAPDITVPYVNVMVTYQGVAPADMESLVTIPIERKLTGLSGVKEITSTSLEGASAITIEFNPDVDIDDALQKVRDKVDLAEPDIPPEADDPMINEINLAELPIIYVGLQGDIPIDELNDMAEDLEEELETIPEVLDVDVIGGVEREILIEVDPDRVAEYGISLADLVTLTQIENVNTPSGAMELGEAKYNIRVPGEFAAPREITDLVVKRGESGIVYLRDIAEIRDTFKERTTYSRLDGLPSISLAVSKRSGENAIAVSNQVQSIVETLTDRTDGRVQALMTVDQSEDIKDMVSELENSILSGLILVLIVIFLFLGVINAVFVALAIPVSMLFTFAVLNVLDVTLNMVVLFSLILALGMLVDNGIVIIENIYRHRQMGDNRITASKKGAAEVAWPIIASTLTTLAAFFPLFFWPGIWGEFMMFLPMTVSLALIGSLLVGLIVNPALASVLMYVPKRARRRKEEDHRPNALLRAYRSALRLALQWRVVTITLAFVVLLVIVATWLRSPTVLFVPETEPRRADVKIDLPEGTTLEASDSYARRVEDLVAPYADNLDYVIANVGSQSGGPLTSGGGTTTHLSTVTLDFPKMEDSEMLPSEISRELRIAVRDIPGADIRVEKEEMGPPPGAPVTIEISGDDYDVLARIAEDVKREIRDLPGLVDLRDDYDKGKPEVEVVVDREQALNFGLSTQFVGLAVKAAIQGRKAGEYREGDEEYDVTVKFPEYFRQDLSNLRTMMITNAAGAPIPFSSVARLKQSAGLGSIKHIDRKRTITVEGDAEEGTNPNALLAMAKKRLQGFTLPPGYAIAFTGQDEEQTEAMDFLSSAFLAAVMLILFVLVTQFNSLIQSLIILSAVLLSLAGVFLGLIIADMPFVVIMTGVGCISLAGVVVNNAIVLLDFINQLRREGRELNEAIVEAGLVRFRPVMLTAITTILGLIPMAVGISFDFREGTWVSGGESAQWWGPMAVAVIFGLAFATVLTLIVVPTLYSLLEETKSNLAHGVRRIFHRKSSETGGA